MRRVFVGFGLLAVVAVIGLVVAPVWTGAVAERQYQRALEVIEDEPQLRLLASDYDRGYRVSNARVEVELIGPAADGFMAFMDDVHGIEQPLVFVLNDRIAHGPLTAAGGWVPGAAHVDSRVQVADGIAQHVPVFADDDTVFSAETRIRFDGSSRMRFETPAWDVVEDESAFSFTGFHGTLDMDATMTSGELDIGFDRLSLSEGGMTWSARGVRLWATPRNLGGQVWTGESVLEVDTVGVNGAEIEGLRLESESGVDDGAMNMSLDATAHGAVVDGYRIDESRLRASLKNIDQAAVEQLIELGDALELGHIDEQTMGIRFMGLLPQLLDREPEFLLDELSVALPEGMFQARARLAWSGPRPTLEDPFAALNGLSVEVDITGPEDAWHRAMRAYVREQLEAGAEAAGRDYSEEELEVMVSGMTGQQISALIGDGVLQRQERTLRSHIVVEDGLVQVNGRNLGPVWAMLPMLSQ